MAEKYSKFDGILSPSDPLYESYITLPTTTSSTLFSQGYVEWYWVALGLVVPVFLGALFCVLDHIRRKQAKSFNSSEQRIESMCERNKYVPPNYEDVIPNNIVIDSLPDLRVESNDRITLLPHSSSHQHLTAAGQTNEETDSQTPSSHTDTTSISTIDCHIEDEHRASTSTVFTYVSAEPHADNQSEPLSEVSLPVEAPPSYDEYDKYEVFGSKTQLV